MVITPLDAHELKEWVQDSTLLYQIDIRMVQSGFCSVALVDGEPDICKDNFVGKQETPN